MNNNLSEIKILIKGLLQDIESVESAENLPIYKWEDIMISLDIIRHKLNTFKSEHDRLLLKDINNRLEFLQEQIGNFEADTALKGVPEVGLFAEIPQTEDMPCNQEPEKREDLDLEQNQGVVNNFDKLTEDTAVSEEFSEDAVVEVEDEDEDEVESDEPFISPVVSGKSSIKAPQPGDLFASAADDEPFELFSDTGETLLDVAIKSTQNWRSDYPGPKIGDINDGITFNDRILLLNKLFYGDSDQYRLSISRLNELNSFDEAVEYLQAAFPDWDEQSDTVYRFYMIVRRRFDV